MAQNTSHAVMAQRHEPKSSLDDFPTPPWATRALFESVLIKYEMVSGKTALEPACGRGYMSRVMSEYFRDVMSCDVHDYGYGEVRDFLSPDENYGAPSWVITNPPFKHAEEFAMRANDVATEGFALLVRTSFLEGVGRHQRLFTENPPTCIAQFSERVPMVKGRVDKKASTATSYCWMIWVKSFIPLLGNSSPTFVWIPPCRKILEMEHDYA